MKINKLNLKVVYKNLEKVLGRHSFVLPTLIKKVVEDNSIATIGIDHSRTIYYNPGFLEKYVESNEELSALLVHELFHSSLGDVNIIKSLDPEDKEFKIKKLAANLAMDCRINSAIRYLYKSINAGTHIASIYKRIDQSRTKEGEPPHKEPLHALLYFDPSNKELIEKEIGAEAADLYEKINLSNKIKDYFALYTVLLEYFRKNAPPENKFVFIGNHGDIPEEMKDLIEKIRQEIGRNIRNEIEKGTYGRKLAEGEEDEERSYAGKEGGSGSSIATRIIEETEGYENKTINAAFLKKVAIRHLAANMLLSSTVREGKWNTSPVMPPKFTRPDIVKIAAGIPILLWKHYKEVNRFVPNLVPIYFDVSGSMDKYIPMIIDLICNIDGRINHVWCFSTVVVRHTIDDLIERKITTTGGTSFKCVVDHAVQNEFKDIMVVTDGYGDFPVQGKHPNINSIVTVLTDQSTKENWFSKNYENTHDLEEVIKG